MPEWGLRVVSGGGAFETQLSLEKRVVKGRERLEGL